MADDAAAPTGGGRPTGPGMEVRRLYGPGDLLGWDAAERLGPPGVFPYTRGIHPAMYRDRLWTMRQYAGFGTAESTNRRWRQLLANGSTGLSCAFDLPTQMGYDSDHPMAAGEVGRVGVAINSVDDMRALLDGLPLERVTTSMTINATAAVLLLLYQLVAEERGVAASRLGGTVQNDVLKEYVARGTYIYPPGPSLRLATDIFSYCHRHLPRWNPISVSGYHMREAGSTAVQELAFTLANAIAYLEAAVGAGLAVDQIAPRMSFFWNAHNDLFQEVAKFRASRRMWAHIVRDRFGASEESSWRLRFHVQTGGSTLAAQQPDVNVARVTLQALSAVLGGTQSLHTNGYDEAIGLPTEQAAVLALRTQQVIAHESGVVDTVDPMGGSWFVESLTDEMEAAATSYLDRIDAMGGAVAAIEAGYMQGEIEEAAFAHARAVEDGSRVVVGVNRYVTEPAAPPAPFPVDPALAERQVASVRRLRDERDGEVVRASLSRLGVAARGTANLLPPMKEALALRATLGEVSDVLREAFGEYRRGG